MRRIPRSYLQLANFGHSEIRSTGSCRALLRTFSRLPSGGFEDHRSANAAKTVEATQRRGRGTE